MLTAKKIIGNFGEQLACDFLTRRGYLIIGRNKKIGRREIDIIAALNGNIVFVEVKTLAAAGMAPAEDALTRRQIETLKKAIRLYCWSNRIKMDNARLDFVSVKINRCAKTAKLKHYPDIF
ncbi:MAG: YraN family protein [Patescibacteria group bacterium]|nr:YraN family protein [Patescibacteria group bacterium]